MARQAEAERERRAQIINAEGEFQAAARLNDAADVISRNPVTIQLRYLQTLIEVSHNQSSTIVFPLPIDVLQPLMAAAQNRRESGSATPGDAGLDEALAAAREALDGAAPDPARIASTAPSALAFPSEEPAARSALDVADPASP